jgi:hypothetical protein
MTGILLSMPCIASLSTATIKKYFRRMQAFSPIKISYSGTLKMGRTVDSENYEVK